MISGKDEVALYGMMGAGKMPFTGGPSGSLRATIGQTLPFETYQGNSSLSLTSGQMSLAPIFLLAGQTINNINFMSTSAEATGTHLWFAIYDDGRGSTTSGQLALLGQTNDQTGAAAFGSNTNLGLSLMNPCTTTYSGYYYIAIMCTATTPPGIRGTQLISSASIQIGSTSAALIGLTAGSGLTNMAPNPSGAVSFIRQILYAYVS